MKSQGLLNPNLQSFCSDLQAYIYNVILGFSVDQQPTLYSPFGNSNTSEYQTITNSKPSSQVSHLKRITFLLILK